MDRKLSLRPLIFASLVATMSMVASGVQATDLGSLHPEHTIVGAPLTDIAADMPAEHLESDSTEPGVLAIPIAEPGSIGLMALAGLMGGAIAMRRRLG